MARIQWEGRTVDVFTTHLVSYTKVSKDTKTKTQSLHHSSRLVYKGKQTHKNKGKVFTTVLFSFTKVGKDTKT